MPTGKTPDRGAPADGAVARAERLNTRAAGVVGLAVMCSRVLGLVREQICAALFGGGGAMDAFTAAFRIPNLLRDLFAEGALSTAFVTTFSKTIARERRRGGLAAREQGGDADGAGARRDLRARHGVLAPSSWRRSRRASMPTKAALTATLTRIMFPFILLVSLAALVMGMLNAQERVRHAGHGLELLQPRLDRRRRRCSATGSIRTSVRAP